MFPSLHIKNYRILRDLELKNLGRVNLIAGKNNTGKSSVLEAIWLLINGFELDVMWSLLSSRGEKIDLKSASIDSNEFQIKLKSLGSLFSGRTFRVNSDERVEINTPLKNLSVRFVKYVEKTNANDFPNNFSIERKIVDASSSGRIGVEVVRNGLGTIKDLLSPISLFEMSFVEEVKSQYIYSFEKVESGSISKLWDKIALTSKEENVIQALHVIDSTIEKLTFTGEVSNLDARQAIIRLKNNDIPVPLKSMGDGINRILNIILSLVNAENGYLLIDEFENGLHHSVQEDLWKMVFQLAAELNVQVFATTHSYDCIRAFSKVALDDKKVEGRLIRLDNVKGEIKPTYYSEEELRLATANNIEVR